MKFSEINKRYTEIVTEYMNKGYTINTASMRGSQGEITKIDLTDGTEIIRILIGSFHEYNDWGTEGIEILVGKVTDDVKPNSNNHWGTIWNDHLEIIHQERFYEIGRHGINFYGSKEEAERANKIRSKRWEFHRRNEETRTRLNSKKAIEIAEKIIRTKFNYKRINISEIKLTKYIEKNKIGYLVSYHNNTYHLK